MRGEMIDSLYDLMAEREDLYFVVADMGINLVERFEEKYPNRFLNVGIAEQSLIHVAAGLCNIGYKPIVYTISNFLIHRCYEQIRNDIVMHGYPLTLIGTSTGYDNAQLGPTHHIIDDWGVFANLPNVEIYCPGSSLYAKNLVQRSIDSEKVNYIRVPKGSFEGNNPDKDFEYEEGSKNLIVSYGSTLPLARSIYDKSPKAGFLLMHRLHPLEGIALKPIFKQYEQIHVIEDHFPQMGMYGAICRLCMEECINIQIHSHAPRQYSKTIGSSLNYYANSFGFDEDQVIEKLQLV